MDRFSDSRSESRRCRRPEGVRAEGPNQILSPRPAFPSNIHTVCVDSLEHCFLPHGSLPEFCRTSPTGKMPAPNTLNPRGPCLPECSANEHCLGLALTHSTSATWRPYLGASRWILLGRCLRAYCPVQRVSYLLHEKHSHRLSMYKEHCRQLA